MSSNNNGLLISDNGEHGIVGAAQEPSQQVETGMAGHQHRNELSFTKFICNGREEYDLLPFAYPEMFNVSSPDMFKEVSMATVRVNLQRPGERPGDRCQHMESVSGKIAALIRDKNIVNSAYFLVGSMLFTRTPTEGRLRSNPMALARSVVAVPSAGWVLRIEVDLHIKIKTSNGEEETKHLNDITVDFNNDNDNESETKKSKTYEAFSHSEGFNVQVKITRNDKQPNFPLQLTCPVEVKMESGYLTLVYTIGDEMSFTEFIMALRRIVADHPDREELLDGHHLLNLSSSRGHPVLAKQRPVQPARWLRIKLQVVEDSQTLATTLIMWDDNLYVHGFCNKEEHCYVLRDEEARDSMITRTFNNPSKTELVWGVKYRTILHARTSKDAVAKLADNRPPLGCDFARMAVRRLSSSFAPDDRVDGLMSARVALAGLILMVCESARMNSVLDLFVQGWKNGTRLTKNLMKLYVWDYGNKSGDLLRWKSKGYAGRHPIKALRAIHLVLRKSLKPRHGKGGGGGSPGPSQHNGGGSNRDRSGGNRSSGGGPPGPSYHRNGDRGGRKRVRDRRPEQYKRYKHYNAGSSDVRGTTCKARDAASGGDRGRESEHASATDTEGSPDRQSEESSGAGRTGGSEEARDDSGSRGGNSSGQPRDGDGDSDDDDDDDDPRFLGRPRVELLSMRADLGAISKNITVFDGKRGQIIYTKKKDGQQGGWADLELTGPYTGISASGCFAIVIDTIPGGSIQWEWDCYDPDYAKEVDGPPAKREIKAQDGSKVAEVMYTVISNAREAMVRQVKLRLKDGHTSHGGISAKITALIDGFNDEHKSVLFRQRLSTAGDNSWFPIELARKVLAVPCDSALHIEVNLHIETKDGEAEEVKVPLRLDNKGIHSNERKASDGNQVEVEVEVTWYPEISQPSHPPELNIEEADKEKSITALSTEQSSGALEEGTSEDICKQKPDATLQEPSHQVETGLHGVLSVSHSSHSTSEGASSIMPEPLMLVNSVGWGISILGWVISPIMTKLVNKGWSYLDDVTSSSADKLQNLEEKVEHLKLMFEAAQASPDAEEKSRRWVKKLKSAFYDAEDILDAIDYHRLKCKAMLRRQSEKATVKEDFKFPPGSKDKLKETLKGIEMLIDEGVELLPLLGSTSSGGNMKSSPEQTTGSGSLSKTTSEPPKVFGRDEDAERIISMLNDDTAADLSVIGIHGISGSGKTTLVQHVCDCVKKKNSGVPYFEVIMWIHVTRNFNVHTVYKEMLEIASGKKMDNLSNLDMLQRELKKSLKGRKFLLVLDDVWYSETVDKQDDLKKLLSPLKEADKGSRVLVTSRTADAAKLLGAQNPMPISDMDEDEFFKMFMHYALHNSPVRDQDKGKFETIGRKISLGLRKSPLAARTVAGQLRQRTSRAEDIGFWIDTLNRKGDLLKDTMGALWWSYHQLEEHVRQCFAYCSMFPRRYELKREELIKMWMAQGFGDTSKTANIESAADECFEVLLSTSFIQLKSKTYDLEYSYTVHDLLHDLAERVAGSDYFRIEKDMVDIQIPQDVRHLFIDSYNPEEFIEQIVKLDTLRTLVMSRYYNTNRELTAENCERILKNLKKLRFVSVFLATRFEEIVIPECIGELKHLRYLGLNGISFASRTVYMPRAFTKLYHLQELFLPNASQMHYLDSDHMADLENLRRIVGRSSNIPNIGRMPWLQTLGDFYIVKKEKGYEITQLENLNNIHGKLHIQGLGNIQSKEEARRANLSNKLHVSHLILDWEPKEDEETGRHQGKKQKTTEVFTPPAPEPEEILEALHPPVLLVQLLILNYGGSTFPSWLSGEDGKLEHLESLGFYYCHGSGSQFKFSKPLPKLHRLNIDKCSWNAFPDNIEQLASLEVLIINDCRNIQSLPDNIEQLASLEVLIINICTNIQSLPGLPSSLKVFKIHGCPDIKSLPGLPSSLKKLQIEYCKNIKTLPELPPSLEVFLIDACPDIKSLPRLPSSLKELQIEDCPNINTLPELPLSLKELQCERYLKDRYRDKQAIDRNNVVCLDDLDSETDDSTE